MTTVEVKGLWMKRYRSLYVSLFLFHTKTKDAFRESLIYCTLWLFGASTMVVGTYYDTVYWNLFIQNGGTFTFATVLVQTLNSRYDILNDLNLLMITSWYACRYIRSVYIKTKLLPRCVELNPGCFAPFLIFCTELFNVNIVAKHMMNFGIFFVNM